MKRARNIAPCAQPAGKWRRTIGIWNCRPKESRAPKLTFEELRAALRQVGDERYHHQHPFHVLMHEGKLSRGQLQAWALNRYYYQSIIPIKDAIILSRATDPAFRRAWRKRIVDHDGDQQRNGGILRWIKLAEATGLDRERVERARRNSAGNAIHRE